MTTIQSISGMSLVPTTETSLASSASSKIWALFSEAMNTQPQQDPQSIPTLDTEKLSLETVQKLKKELSKIPLPIHELLKSHMSDIRIFKLIVFLHPDSLKEKDSLNRTPLCIAAEMCNTFAIEFIFSCQKEEIGFIEAFHSLYTSTKINAQPCFEIMLRQSNGQLGGLDLLNKAANIIQSRNYPLLEYFFGRIQLEQFGFTYLLAYTLTYGTLHDFDENVRKTINLLFKYKAILSNIHYKKDNKVLLTYKHHKFHFLFNPKGKLEALFYAYQYAISQKFEKPESLLCPLSNFVHLYPEKELIEILPHFISQCASIKSLAENPHSSLSKLQGKFPSIKTAVQQTLENNEKERFSLGKRKKMENPKIGENFNLLALIAAMNEVSTEESGEPAAKRLKTGKQDS